MGHKMYKPLTLLILLLLFFVSCSTKSDSVTNETIAGQSNGTYYLLDKLANANKSILEGAESMLSAEIENVTFSNADSVCQVYVDALNRHGYYNEGTGYPYSDTFFDNPVQPNTTTFTYPKWEQLDIYEYKDAYLIIRGKSRKNIDEYPAIKAELEKFYAMEDNRSAEYKKSNRQRGQMYYAQVDIDNDGKSDNIIKLIGDRYAYRDWSGGNHIIVFADKDEKSFKHLHKILNEQLDGYDNVGNMLGIFSYKGKTYISDALFNYSYDCSQMCGFRYMVIKRINSEKKADNICLISTNIQKEF
jgi:hypothetical protein